MYTWIFSSSVFTFVSVFTLFLFIKVFSLFFIIQLSPEFYSTSFFLGGDIRKRVKGKKMKVEGIQRRFIKEMKRRELT